MEVLHLRRGVWLRVRALPEPLVKKVRKHIGILRLINWCVVSEIRPDGKVYLEFWCSYPLWVSKDGVSKHTVIGFVADEDPAWICEGDMGRGYKE